MMNNQFGTANEAFSRCEIILDALGRPVDYKFIEANPPFLEMMGLGGQNIIGNTAREVSIETSKEDLNLYFQAAVSHKAAFFEQYFPGSCRRFKVIVFSESPNEFCTLSIALSETESSSKYRMLFENSKSIILIMKENGDILEANRTAIETYGYTIEELTRLNIRDLRDKSGIDSFESEFRQAVRSGIFFETLHKRKDGSSFPVDVSSVASHIENQRFVMSIVRDISERKKLESELFYMANHDSLTNIPNRTYILNQLNSLCEEALQKHEQLAVLFFDIDKFKRINDTYGHQLGDVVLKEIATRVTSVVPGLFGRIGGDEFVVLQLFSAAARENIVLMIERIFEQFELPVFCGGVEIPIATSIGISIFPDDSKDRNKLLSRADQAMYHAKKAVGNSYRFYSDIRSAKSVRNPGA